jgi:serine/threonine protein kinase/Flp pilus assembly protein TadD
MGDVYLAHDSQLDRAVALKIPRFGANPHPDDAARFLREARAAAMLSHPNLCPVHDAGEIDGVSFLTMACIEGRPLSEILQAGPPLSVEEAVRLTRLMALAMQEAHRRGVIHRDLKPANVMIDLRGQPVIMDFGLARRSPDTGDLRLTHSGVIMGTPAYMSPEQVNGALGSMGPASDTYSLGVILYELLTGRLPFSGGLGSLMAQIVSTLPPPPSQFRPDLPPDVEAICLKALAKDPGHRFVSMHEFAEALGGVSPRAAPLSTSNRQSEPAPQAETKALERAADRRDKSRLHLAARYYLEKRTEETHRKSIATWYEILDQDPTFAPAWAGLALAYHLLSVRGYASPINACPKGKSAALRALSLDNSLGEAHSVLASIVMEYEWDLEGAELEFQRALKFKPDDAVTHQLYGKCLACAGRHTEAIVALRKAVELDPFSAILSTSLGRHGFLLARRYDQAILQYQKTLEIDPNFWLAHRFLGWAYVLQGRITEGISEFTLARRLHEDSITVADLGYVYGVSGRTTEAREHLDALGDLASRRYVSPDCLAIVHIGLGEKDQAFAWLERAVEDRSEWLCKIRVDPVVDPLRSDPRFDALLQRMKLKS